MTNYDPFAAATAEEPAVLEVPVQAKVTSVKGSDSKIVVTLKGGSGFDAPWIVIHAEDLEDAHRQVTDEADLLVALMERVQKAGTHFSSLSSGQASRTAPQAASNVPAQAQQAPAGSPPAPGPDWTFKAGFSAKTNKPWQAWMPPRGSDDKPLFF